MKIYVVLLLVVEALRKKRKTGWNSENHIKIDGFTLNFQWRNHSIFKNFCALQVQTSWNQAYAPFLSLSRAFQRHKTIRSEASWFGGSHNYKTKQTTFLHLIFHSSNNNSNCLRTGGYYLKIKYHLLNNAKKEKEKEKGG